MEPFDNSSNGIGCGKPARQNITPIFLKALIAGWHDIGSLFHINTRKHLFRFQVVNVTPALLTLAEHHWYHHCQHLFNFQEEIQGLDFLFFLVSTQQPITELEANIHELFAIFGLFLKENWSFKTILHYRSCNPLEIQHSIQDLRKLEFDLVSFLLNPEFLSSGSLCTSRRIGNDPTPAWRRPVGQMIFYIQPTAASHDYRDGKVL